MTELDQELPELVLELIEEFGAEVVYTLVKNAKYNPATSSSAPTVKPFAAKALVEDYSLQGSGQAFASGMVEAGDKKFSMAAAAFPEKPTPGDRLGFNAEVFSVVNIKTTYSGQLPALYEIQGRA